MSTIIQANPVGARVSIVNTATFTDQLNAAGDEAGLATFAQTAGTPELVVSGAGVVVTSGVLAAGTYVASGTTTDGDGNTGVFVYTLTVAPDAFPRPRVARPGLWTGLGDQAEKTRVSATQNSRWVYVLPVAPGTPPPDSDNPDYESDQLTVYFLNGCSNVAGQEPLAFRMWPATQVEIRGALYLPTIPIQVCTLPPGFRPLNRSPFNFPSSDGSTIYTGYVDVDGSLWVTVESSLVGGSGIQFDTDPQDGNWLYIKTTGGNPNDDDGGGWGIALITEGVPSEDDPSPGILLYTKNGAAVNILAEGGSPGTNLFYVDSSGDAEIDAEGTVTLSGSNTSIEIGDNVEIDVGVGPYYLLISGLPTSSSGLPPNAVWNNGGVLNIV